MKPEDVLKIHELIMKQYDEMLAWHSNDEADIMQTIAELAKDLAPSVVSGGYASQCEGNEGADQKIMAAAVAAYNAAYNATIKQVRLQSILDGIPENVGEFKEKFRIMYEAMLRFELYRQFLAINQDLGDLKVKFLERNSPDQLSTKNLIEFALSLQIEKVSAEFKKFEKKHMLTAREKEIILELKRDVDEYLAKFRKYNDEGKFDGVQGAETFYRSAMAMQIYVEKMFGKYRIETESNQSWAPLLKNLLMMLTGVGVIVLAISLGVKAATGQYAFFDKTSLKEVADNERSASEKLIRPPKNVS